MRQQKTTDTRGASKQPEGDFLIYGRLERCRILCRHAAGTVDVERLSDSRCFRVSGLTIAAGSRDALNSNAESQSSLRQSSSRHASAQMMNSASWVIREKETGLVILETFDAAKVRALNTIKYEAVPILEYLRSLNQPRH
jgi:hypothetical protein